jgi:hypothetical protein
MMNLAIWLKSNGFKADQVQTFYPSPMATATAMYHSGLNPLKGISRDARKGERVDIVKGEKRRRLHKAFLRYHDPNNWPLLREALKAMGRADLIGNGQHHLIPTYQPAACRRPPLQLDDPGDHLGGDLVLAALPVAHHLTVCQLPQRGDLVLLGGEGDARRLEALREGEGWDRGCVTGGHRVVLRRCLRPFGVW